MTLSLNKGKIGIIDRPNQTKTNLLKFNRWNFQDWMPLTFIDIDAHHIDKDNRFQIVIEYKNHHGLKQGLFRKYYDGEKYQIDRLKKICQISNIPTLVLLCTEFGEDDFIKGTERRFILPHKSKVYWYDSNIDCTRNMSGKNTIDVIEQFLLDIETITFEEIAEFKSIRQQLESEYNLIIDSKITGGKL